MYHNPSYSSSRNNNNNNVVINDEEEDEGTVSEMNSADLVVCISRKENIHKSVKWTIWKMSLNCQFLKMFLISWLWLFLQISLSEITFLSNQIVALGLLTFISPIWKTNEAERITIWDTNQKCCLFFGKTDFQLTVFPKGTANNTLVQSYKENQWLGQHLFVVSCQWWSQEDIEAK